MSAPNLKGDFSSGTEAYQAAFKEMKGISNNTPSFIFVFSDEMTKAPAKVKNYVPRPTPQAQDSADAWEELFQTEGDFSIFIPGRFFNIIRVDVTNVEKSESKHLCSANAPILLLTDKDGQLKAALEGKVRIKRKSVVDTMVDILKKDGFIQSPSQFARLNSLMTELEKIELDMVFANERLTDAKSTLSEAEAKDVAKAKRAEKKGREAKSSTIISAAQRTLEKIDEDIKSKNDVKFKILDEEYKLLTELKLPAGRMPAQPKQP